MCGEYNWSLEKKTIKEELEDICLQEEKKIREDWIENEARILLRKRKAEIEEEIGPQLQKIRELERRLSLLDTREWLISKQIKRYSLSKEDYIKRFLLAGLKKI